MASCEAVSILYGGTKSIQSQASWFKRIAGVSLYTFVYICIHTYVCNSYVFSLFHLVRFGLNSGMFAFTFSVCPLKQERSCGVEWVGRWENLGGDGKRKQ